MAVWEMVVVLAIVALTLFLFLREVIPVPVTAMLAAALLMLIPARAWEGAILTPEEGLSGFANQATIAVLAMFVLSAGVERSGAVAYISQFLARIAGKSARRQALSLGAVAGPLSGFINNTPVVAVLMPVAARLARDSKHTASKLLMPLSFFAMLGGTLTVIGTSTNLLGNALLPRYGLEPFGFFSFTLVGITALVIAALYFLTIGMRLVPDRGDGDVVDRFDLKGFMAEYEVGEAGDGKTLRDMDILFAKGLQTARVVRRKHILPSPGPSFTVATGDILVIQGGRSALEQLAERSELTPVAEQKYGLSNVIEGDDQEPADIATAELVLAPGNRYEGRTIANIPFEARFGVMVLAVRHLDKVAVGPLSHARLEVGDVLLVQGSRLALERLQESSAFILTREREKPVFRTDKIAISLSIVAAVVLLASFDVTPIVTAALGGAVAMVLTGCLRIEEFLGSIHWNIVLLLAGIIPLGLALEKTGGADLLATGLIAVGSLLPPLVFLMLIFLATSLITEMLSNNASVVLLIPIVVAAAAALGLDGRPFALAVMLSASTSMLTPVGYQTNTMVFGPGNYRFRDYLRVGGPLNLMLVIALPLVIAWLFPLQ